MSKRIVTYLRISTEEQTVDPQRLELQAYCERRGWSVAAEYTDTASGGRSSRKGLDAMMADVRKRRIDTIVVARLDRLGRSLQHLVALIAELDGCGTALVTSEQPIDTSSENPTGRLVAHILMAMSQFEMSLIKERTRAGLRAARAKGKTLGRPRKIDSYSSRVAELWGQGLSKRAIAKMVGVAPSNVMRLLAKAA